MSAEFVDELPPGRGSNIQARQANQAFAAELLANPGRWAKYPTKLKASSLPKVASNIRRGYAPAFAPGGRFEAAIRDGVLYVRAVKE